MKYCPNCGSRIKDDASFCSECGAPINQAERAFTPNDGHQNDDDFNKPHINVDQNSTNTSTNTYTKSTSYNNQSSSIYSSQNTMPKSTSNTSHVLRLIAFIFCILSCISVGFCLIPLIWMVPLTIKVYRSYKDGMQLTAGTKICVLIFVNIIGGVLLLIDDK